jgi:hypothetical protein
MGFHAEGTGLFLQFWSTILLSLHDFREVSSAGAVSAIAANGGILASDTTPAMTAEATSEAHSITWVAANADIIQAQIALPDDFDGRSPVELDLWVKTDNTGGGSIEAASFSVLTSWDDGAQVTDTATDSVPATTTHKVTVRIAAADIPDRASFVNLQLVPGTHANDPIKLIAARLRYCPRDAA